MWTCRGCRSTRCRRDSYGATRPPSPTSCSLTVLIPTRRPSSRRRPPQRRSRAPPTATVIFSRRCCRPATCSCSSRPRRSTARGSWPARSRPSRPAGRCCSCRRTPPAIPTSAETGERNSSRRDSTCRGSFASTGSRQRRVPRPDSSPRPASASWWRPSTGNSQAARPGGFAGRGPSTSPPGSHARPGAISPRAASRWRRSPPASRRSAAGWRRFLPARSARRSAPTAPPGSG